MGCNNCISNIVFKSEIKVKNAYELSEMDLIDLIVEKRKKILKINSIQNFSIDNKNKNIETDFLENIYDENKLCKYLDFLKKNDLKKYELNLLLYFDVLSSENKFKYTNLHFESNIDKFERLIKDILKDNFKKIDYYNNDLLELKTLFSNKIIKTFPEIQKLIEGKEKNEIIINKIREIITIKVNSRITLHNKEMFFKGLINIYVNSFSTEQDEEYQAYKQNLLLINEVIINCIKKIRENDFSEYNEKLCVLLFFAPIIGGDLLDFSKLFIDYYNNDKDNFTKNKLLYDISDNKLIIKNLLQKKIFEFDKAEIINLNSVNELFLGYLLVNNKPDIDPYCILNCVKPRFFQDYNFYTYKKKVIEFNKQLLKNILRSNTIKTLFHFLSPELDNLNIFNNDDIINEIFNSIIFTPFELNKAYGITIKTFLIIFINGLPPKKIKVNKIILLNSSSSFQILGIHEICAHWISAFISFKLKNNFLYNSISYKNFPLKLYEDQFKDKNLLNSDGGEIIEKILFSREMNETTIKEMLFILCKNSYNDFYQDFKNNFKKLKNIDIEILYKNVVQDKDLKDYLDFLGITLEYLKSLEKNEYELKYKRNGDIKRSKCGI